MFEELLCSIYTETEFRRFVKLGSDGEMISQQIPSEGVTNESLVHHTIDLVLRRKLIDHAFFERLVTDVPRREQEIRRSWRSWYEWNQQQTSGAAAPEVTELDSVRKGASDELHRLILRRESLVMEGEDTIDVDASIIHHQSILRRGAQLKGGDFLCQNRYKIIARIGHGSFATVWRAYDRISRRDVAVKVLHAHWADNPTVLERFIQGPHKAARIQHPNIVKILRGTFDDGGYYAYVMEYVPGENLHSLIEQRRIPLRDLLTMFSQICDGLHRAHESGFVHRDIKPSNILIGVDGVPKLADFDLSKVHDLGDTQTGAIMGTILYMAPEVRDNAKNANPSSDLYSLGMTLLFCLLRSDPPLEAPARQRWLAGLSGPPELRKLGERAISRPDQRPKSALAMGQECAALAEHLEVDHWSVTGASGHHQPWSFNSSQPPEDVESKEGRPYLGWAIAVLLVLSLAGFVMIYAFPGPDANPQVSQREVERTIQRPEPKSKAKPVPAEMPKKVVTPKGSEKPIVPRIPPPQTDPVPWVATSQAALDANANAFISGTHFAIRDCARMHSLLSKKVVFICEAKGDGSVRSVKMVEGDGDDAFEACAESSIRKGTFEATGQTEQYTITYPI